MQKLIVLTGIISAALSFTAQAQDVALGEKIFKKCKACHQVGPEAKNKVGPVLTGVVGRPAGSYEGYKYSKSLLAAGEAGLVWDTENLMGWLENPSKFLKAKLDDPKAKAKMALKLKKPEDRANVIAYLSTIESAAAKVCVENGSHDELVFAAEADGGERVLETLAPGEQLCASGGAKGVVSVFTDLDSLEGCSRLVTDGAVEALLDYSEFDRCAWTSNTG